jgi:hypothetical protein
MGHSTSLTESLKLALEPTRMSQFNIHDIAWTAYHARQCGKGKLTAPLFPPSFVLTIASQVPSYISIHTRVFAVDRQSKTAGEATAAAKQLSAWNLVALTPTG